jgi:hypothetical protein
VIGAFNIYSRERDFYGGEEIILLQEITDGISHALEYMEEKVRRREAEEKVRCLNERLNNG